jgi:exopolyphosphatase/pppGpp-phosphohydrolase
MKLEMKQIKNIFISLFLSGAFIANTSISAETIRAAIDFGSGAVKIQIAEVDTEENRIVGETLLAKYIPLGLTEDVATHNGFISEEMAQKAISILRGFKEDALNAAISNGYDEIQFTAIATAVFRKAQNGHDLLKIFEEILGISFQILPQEEEGKLGFLTARALYPNVQKDFLLAWDSGNGSFQMTAIKEADLYQIYQGPLGHGTVRVLLSKDIRRGAILQTHESGNPVLKKEAVELTQRIKELLAPVPDWLQEKLNSRNTVVTTFGDGESIFALVAQALAYLDGKKEPVQQALVSFSDVHKVIDAFIEQGDEFFIAAGLHGKTLTSAIHLSALMEYFGIQEIHYKRSIGNTSGMLIAPQLWKEGTSTL